MKSIRELLTSEDPLSGEALERLLQYREEDSLVDYKETFGATEKEWLEITKDLMAFANTSGGYLVFGVRDATYERIGLPADAVKLLTHTGLILQKINRFLDPPLHLLRCKEFIKEFIQDGKRFVGLLIPESSGVTHVISQDGSFSLPSGEKKCVLRKGTFYVRRSGGNQLGGTRDLDTIFARRVELFRESLLQKIARVVEAPLGSEVVVISPEGVSGNEKHVVIDNTPAAIPVKGMSFSVPPQTTEQEIASWSALAGRDPSALPAPKTLWGWYEARKTLRLQEKFRLEVAKRCLLSHVPVFYWLRGCDAHSGKQMILDALARKPSVERLGDIVGVAAFLGRQFHRSIVSRLKGQQDKLARHTLEIPSSGPRSVFRQEQLEVRRKSFKGTTVEFRNHIEEELDSIVAAVREQGGGQPGLMERWRARELDCFLYAQDDQYVRGNSELKQEGKAMKLSRNTGIQEHHS